MNNADYTRYRVRPGKAFSLRDVNPEDTQGHPGKKRASKQLSANLERLSALQERLYAESEGSVLIVVQAMDGGGKDSTIRRVFRGINPQGCYVVNFNAPTPEELEESNEVASHHLQHAGYLKVDIVGRDNARQGSRDNKALADRDLNS